MTTTTTAICPTNVVIRLDNAAGVLTDISGSTNKCEIKFNNLIAEYSVFGNTWQNRKACGKDGSFALDIIYTTTASEALDLLNGWFFGPSDAARSIQVDVPDGLTGSDRYEAEVVLSEHNIPLQARSGEVVMVSMTLLPNGAIVHNNVGS